MRGLTEVNGALNEPGINVVLTGVKGSVLVTEDHLCFYNLSRLECSYISVKKKKNGYPPKHYLYISVKIINVNLIEGTTQKVGESPK